MTKVLDSKDLSLEIKKRIKENIKLIGFKPKVAVIRLGSKKDDLSYERNIRRQSEKLGIGLIAIELSEDTQTDSLIKVIDKLNRDSTVGGILIFRPLPNHIDEDLVNESISIYKDIDCMNPVNKSKVYSGDVSGFIPLAPKAAVMLLEYYNYQLEGKDCVIINDSNVVGKPLLMLLISKFATVNMCHIKTEDLKSKTKLAKYIFTAIGKSEMLNSSYFNKDSVVIDIGISTDSNGNIKGDCYAEDIEGYVEAYSPVPNGVGSITTILMLDQSLKFFLRK